MVKQTIRCAFGLCGSFCMMEEAIGAMERLKEGGMELLPLMSYHAFSTDTRFGKARDFVKRIEDLSGKTVISSIEAAEPIGPKKLADVFLIAPCTGNSLAKLAAGITDTPLLMGAKSHLRNGGPLVICLASNDALSAGAKNIGKLLNTRQVFFVPFSQDEPLKKPRSLISHFDLIEMSIESALKGEQLQPVLRAPGG